MAKVILYVDDDADDQLTFAECLKELAPEVICHMASDGFDALSVIARIPLPTCIYIDINMPLMNGVDLLRALKSHPRYHDVPTFIISTTISEEVEKTCRTLGAIDVIRKPNSFPEMVSILKTCFLVHAMRLNLN